MKEKSKVTKEARIKYQLEGINKAIKSASTIKATNHQLPIIMRSVFSGAGLSQEFLTTPL